MNDFDPAFHLKPPNNSLREHLLNKLLRETLPYLQAVENSPSTSVVLRALINEISHVTKKGNT